MDIATSPPRAVRTAALRRPRPPERVALFTGAYNHIADGVSLTLNRLVDYLERQGTDVLVFAPTVDDPPVDHNGPLVRIPSLPAPGRPDYRIALGLSATARERLEVFRPTLIHIATPDLLGYAALRHGKKESIPVVASYHTHFSSYLKYYRLDVLEPVLWAYLRHFYQQCEQVYVPSPSMGEVLENHGIDEGLRLWERGVNTTHFNPAQRSDAWRQRWDIAADEVVVSFVSRLVWEKGLNRYAEVTERLERNDIPHRSLIVGDGPAREELEERLPNTIFTGHLKGDDLARAYASSDVFLFPSDTETFGNVTLEAMASGLPTVCADAPGSRSLVNDGATGFLAPAEDTDAFYDAVARLVSDADLRRSMGQNARKRAQHYDWEAVLGRLVGYYDELLHHRAFAGDGAAVPEPSLHQ